MVTICFILDLRTKYYISEIVASIKCVTYLYFLSLQIVRMNESRKLGVKAALRCKVVRFSGPDERRLSPAR